MLKEFVEKKHYRFVDHIDTWEDAIRESCKSLEADGTVDPSYADLIIDCVKKYGPYIVIMPNVAMPHSTENADGVHKTAIGFMKVEDPVSFDDSDPDKKAQLFFTLAACDGTEHLKNMQNLVGLLSNEELVAELANAKSADDLLRLSEKYENEEQS